MARARKKSKPARKRAAKRRKAAVARQSSDSNWAIGAGVLAAAILLGGAVYFVSTDDQMSNSVASLVEQVTPEIPESVKQIPDQVRKQLPEMPSLSLTHTTDSGPNESAPSQ